jgi:hypothetical protein
MRRAPLIVVALLFLAAPTAGDIGSCNQPADDLDANKFFGTKQDIDCQRCTECGFTTMTCARACGSIMGGAFPRGCYPVVHDGEVCLDALLAAGCEAYRDFIDDAAPTVPTECDFCPPRPPADAGAD